MADAKQFKVQAGGRSGGWLEVESLGSPEDWTREYYTPGEAEAHLTLDPQIFFDWFEFEAQIQEWLNAAPQLLRDAFANYKEKAQLLGLY